MVSPQEIVPLNICCFASIQRYLAIIKPQTDYRTHTRQELETSFLLFGSSGIKLSNQPVINKLIIVISMPIALLSV